MAAHFTFASSVFGLLVFLHRSNAGPALSVSSNAGKSLGESGLTRINHIPLRSKAFTLGASNIDKSSTLPEPRGHSSSEYEYQPIHYATYAKDFGYNPLAIIGISVFGVLGLILFLQLLGIQTFRSITNSPFSLPVQLYNLSEDLIPELMLRVSEMLAQTSIGNIPIAETPLENDSANNTRKKRSTVKKEIGVMDWIRAYRRDQVEYQCVRKLACEVLANSNLAARSVKSNLGNTLLSVLGRTLEDGSDVVSLIQGVIDDPEKCIYLAPDDLCDEQ